MSCRVDTAPLLPGACVVSLYAGHGIRGDAIAATGEHGASPIYNDLSLPADAAKEYRWAITVPPASGALDPAEDGSYTYTPPTGATNLTATYTYRLWEDGVDIGTATETIVLGSGSGSAYAGTVAGMGVATSAAGGVGAYTAPDAPAYAGTVGGLSVAASVAGGAGAYTAPDLGTFALASRDALRGKARQPIKGLTA